MNKNKSPKTSKPTKSSSSTKSFKPFRNTALITGASSGIGKDLAIIHAEKKGDLVLVARREDKLKEFKQELEKIYGVQVLVVAKDLTKLKVAKEIFQTIKKAGIEIEYLINNAGFGGQGKFHERKWEDELSMINLNVVSLVELTHLFLPEMVSRNCGRILNVSSTASLMPGPLQAIYFATKAFVTSFSNAVNEELCHCKITVTALLPGATETEFSKRAGLVGTKLFEKAFSARGVAEAGYAGMMRGKLNVIAGVTFAQKVMLKLAPFIPRWILLPQIRKMQEQKIN